MNLKKYLILNFLLILFANLSGQNVFFGVIQSYINREVSLTSQFGDESEIVKTTTTDKYGSFEFDFSKMQKGLYRVYLDNNESFDIILYNEPEVEIFTRTTNSMYSMIVLESEENKQLYSYLSKTLLYSYKLDLLKQFYGIYPDEKFASRILREKRKILRQDRRNLKRVIRQNSDSFAGRYISYFKEVNPPKRHSQEDKQKYIKENYLELFDFEDKEMIYSDAYNNVVFNYLRLYNNNPEQLHQAANNILDKVETKNQKVFNYIFEYLLRGFESLEMYDIAAKIANDYGEICIEADENLATRIKSYTKMGIGMNAPDFSTYDIHGNKIKLSETNSDYILIVFWASWCNYCKFFLEDIEYIQNYLKSKNVKIVGVSLDNDKQSISKYLEDIDLNWTVISDYKVWEGDIVTDYAIYATPTAILLDSNLEIIAKPNNLHIIKNIIN